MPRTDDRSPGDGRQAYSDIGGVEARHAQTHDVRREELTNPTGPDRSAEEFAEDLVPAAPANELRGHVEESSPAAADKDVREQLPELTNELLGRLSIVNVGKASRPGRHLSRSQCARARPIHGARRPGSRSKQSLCLEERYRL